jgi:hypothetical protein
MRYVGVTEGDTTENRTARTFTTVPRASKELPVPVYRSVPSVFPGRMASLFKRLMRISTYSACSLKPSTFTHSSVNFVRYHLKHSSLTENINYISVLDLAESVGYLITSLTIHRYCTAISIACFIATFKVESNTDVASA